MTVAADFGQKTCPKSAPCMRKEKGKDPVTQGLSTLALEPGLNPGVSAPGLRASALHVLLMNPGETWSVANPHMDVAREVGSTGVAIATNKQLT